MPEPAKFLKGYDLQKGKIFAGSEIQSAKSDHIKVKLFREYKYNIIVTFKSNVNHEVKNLINVLNQKMSEERVIYSHYGNPYLCSIEKIKPNDVEYHDNNQIVVYMTGHAVRIKKSEVDEYTKHV